MKTIDKDNKTSCIHTGHRKRLFEQAFKNGVIDGLSEIQKLELLLTYVIPRKDTNILAHKLLSTFGSISRVLDASVIELEKVEGIAHRTAMLLSFLPQFFEHYRDVKLRSMRQHFTSRDSVEEFLLKYVETKTEECSYLMLVDKNMKFVSIHKLAEGNATSVKISVDKIINIAKSNAKTKYVCLCHNHPFDTCNPSIADINATQELIEMFDKTDYVFYEHFIFGNDGVYRTLSGEYFRFLRQQNDSLI